MTPEHGGHDEIDDESHGPPPHPLDRVWVHPSELPPLRARPRRGAMLASAIAGLAVGTSFVVLAAFIATGESGDARDTANVSTDPDLATSIVLVTASSGADAPSGSGVSLGAGQVVTSGQLAREGDELSVKAGNGREYDAVVVGRDDVYDLALLEVDGSLPAASLGRADLVADTNQLLAIAATGPDQHWMGVTQIRTRDAFANSTNGDAMYTGLITTDLPSTSAHAGGALVSRDGRVIAILATPPGTDLTGTAIPIERIMGMCEQIRRNGAATHGWFGVLADDTVGGARVSELFEGGPAADAGLAVGDVVVSINGEVVRGAGDLASTVRKRPPGDTVTVTFLRHGREHSVEVTLGALDVEALATS